MTETTRWYKPKLIEVAIPLEDINRESAREKSIRHGHPSTLHLWWARRPLAACRAVLFAQLVDDPSAHPEQFPTEEAQATERERLHGIIKRLVVWENIHDEGLLEAARMEIRRSCGGNPPLILDPFAGGGSIPLEAQRLGLEAHASDLNPVAVLINKALIEIPPRWAGQPPVFPGAAEGAYSWPRATGLAEDVRRYGQWMRVEAEKRVGHLYPKVKLSDGSRVPVIAWIWARTVICPNPACRGRIPLISSYILSRKKGNPARLEPIVDGKSVRFNVNAKDLGSSSSPKRGRGATFVCEICGDVTSDAYVKAEATAGRMSSQLVSIVAEGNRQRIYLPTDDEQVEAAKVERPSDVPDEEISKNPRWFSPTIFGLETYGSLFADRQLVTLTVISDLVRQSRFEVARDARLAGLGQDAANDYGVAVATYLGLALSRIADRNNTLCTWDAGPVGSRSSTGGSARTASVRNAFARQALPMTWDYAEASPFSSSGGSIESAMSWLVPAISGLPATVPGIACQADAANPEVFEGKVAVATDPPYYDNIGYAELSDFFYVWLRRALADMHPEIFGTVLTPKSAELVATPFRFGGSREKANKHFEDGFVRTFSLVSKMQDGDIPTTLFYAFKQSENNGRDGVASTGWETMLEGLLRAGFSVTATWPMRTELSNRMVGSNTNALASSILLAARPRNNDAGVIDRRGLIAALREELPGALRTLQQGGIAPVDLPQTAIGPGMAVFSRYGQVNEPDGSAMKVRTALALINQVLDEVLSQQEGDFGEDTRWCLEWFKSYGFDEGPYGVAETLSKAKNTSVAGLERAGVLKSGGGKVRLLSVGDVPAGYDPARDDRVSEWEIVLHLAKRLQEEGGDAAARLMAVAKAVVDVDAVRELAYLLFSIAERRGWAESARLFNGLGTSWSDIADASRKPEIARPPVQGQLGFDEDGE